MLTFWIVAYSIFLLAGQAMSVPSTLSNYDRNKLTTDGNNFVNSHDVTPALFMFQIMFFQVDSTQMPVIVGLILDVFFGLTILILLSLIKNPLINIDF